MPLIDFDVSTGVIEGLAIITTKQISDERGTVREFFRESTYGRLSPAAGARWAQVNVTETKQGAIRGLHGEQMTKLVGAASGEAFGAYVDARQSSSTFGAIETVRLVPGLQVLVPEGVLNGFQSVSNGGCQYLYCFDREWSPDIPGVGANALDPALEIEWPLDIDPEDRSLISAKDAALPPFAEIGDS